MRARQQAGLPLRRKADAGGIVLWLYRCAAYSLQSEARLLGSAQTGW